MRTYDGYSPTLVDRSTWTLPHILDLRARTHGERVWLDVPSSGTQLTFAEARDVAGRIASGLLARGHEPGDRLVIMLANRAEYLLAWLGAGLAGIAEVPVNTAYRGAFFEHQVRTVAPSGAMVSGELAERFVESAAACASVHHVYVVEDDAERAAKAIASLEVAGFVAEHFTSLTSSVEGKLPTVRPRDLASVFFTSGTTGLSKGVMMSHAHMVFEADETISLTRLSDADTYLSVGPLFHGNAQFLAAYPSLLAGARFVLRERFSARNWLEWVRSSRATVTNFVGVMMDFTFKQPPTEHDADNDLRCIFAAPTASSIVEAFKERFGVEAFVEVFGLTETSMPVMSPYGESRPPGAAGLAFTDWFDVRLVDPETDEEVEVGEMGELVVRPRYPFIMSSGYFNMPDKTAEALRNCWFHTGDGLRRDAEGWYYFVDRLKDAIRRRGENISSYEVEQALLAHPGISECAVVAAPAEQEAGEDEVMAFVVLAPGAELGAEQLWAYCDQRLPYFAVPRYVNFVERLPMTPSGKIQKAELRRAGAGEGAADRVAVLGSMPSRP